MAQLKRQIDELGIHAIIAEIRRYATSKKSKIGLRHPNELRPTPIFVYRKVSDYGQNIICRIRDNIVCGTYTTNDFWNYLIHQCATGMTIAIERLPTGHEEICRLATSLTNERFENDKQTFHKAHTRFVKDGIVGTDGNILPTYYDCFSGASSIMFRMLETNSISPRFYLSGYLKYMQNAGGNGLTVGVVESTYRKFIQHLRY